MSNARGTRNDIAWGKLFEKYQIVDEIDRAGHFCISATEINEFREARLMTKFDDIEHLPALFRENGLSILPVSRGDYIIANVDAYRRLEINESKPIVYSGFPGYLESLDYENITSEATAINCAYVSGILSHFLEEDDLRLTVSGRMGSGLFRYHIDRRECNEPPLQVSVKNAQIEIDGGFEGPKSLSLVEAKNSIPYTFLVRQLYYPFRLWRSRIAKPVRPIFLTYTNRTFHLYEYQFRALENYSSLSLLKEQRYSLQPDDISLSDIVNVRMSTKTVPEPEQPFPQADSFERVINLCELLYESENGKLSHEEITTAYNFVGRQTHYYVAAGIYLGLIDKGRNGSVRYALSERGKILFRKNHRERQMGFAAAIFAHSVFAQGFDFYLQNGAPPSNAETLNIMRNANLRNMNTESTYTRRARTVRRWLNWIIGLQSR